ncbi:GT2 family glycosyltransferase [Fontibacillus phaseoli]|uniref:GT2 family glycosyltransferase n=1 Tax=Fontibacillus phaseoli TaxID=1416533 RepID=A0A369BH15_9BACL|nr:glycosyltransferase family 2 protein [Fontibacillus phaseoli]RCX19767.1 GT2 family glycosyltransferase [Fontibacillus phaseoli]
MPERNADFHRGYEAGYARGVLAGKQNFGTRFDGVSIIIPTFNKQELLLECLDSIEACTDYPYEIIVVDNGSQDGTAELLRKRRGPLRLAVHERNLGFARAVNTGLMMAKGSHIVLLNNDVLVTERWLSQLLRCLRDCPEAAAVGPVTNYIGGEQQIDVPYIDLPGMRDFAAAHNRSDPAKWRDTNRLVGFCLLIPRSTFEQIGYFDEGYEIGNYEDDDWMIRLRFLGKKLKIAGDTFVHHYGSMTMKALGAHGFADVNGRNENFFAEKWGDPHAFLQRVDYLSRNSGDGLRMSRFLPSNRWVKSSSGRVYRLKQGVRYPLARHLVYEELWHQAVRLSINDLLQLPLGEEIAEPDYHSTRHASQDDGDRVYRDQDGRLYQIESGERREISSAYTCRAWGYPLPEQDHFPPELRGLPEGFPILPPVRLVSEDL